MGRSSKETLSQTSQKLPVGWTRKLVQRQKGKSAGQFDVYVFSPEGKKFRSGNELQNYFKQINSSYNYEDFGFSARRRTDVPKVPQTNPVEKQKNRGLKEKEDQRISSCLSTRKSTFKEALNDALNITKGWTRKLVQSVDGPTAGHWDVYLLSPEGQEFKSRNELRKYLEETNSTHSYADLAFLFKGGDTKKKRAVSNSIHPANDGVWCREAVQRKSGVSAGRFDVYYYSPEGEKFRSPVEVRAYLKQTNSSLTFEELGFPIDTSRNRTIPTPKKKKVATKNKPRNVKLLESTEVLHVDPNLPEGWSRKAVQRQSGKSAGGWDIYLYNPEGKKFRSRNEIRDYIKANNLPLNHLDFDFSIRGKESNLNPINPTSQVIQDETEDDMLIGLSDYEVNSQLEQFMDDSDHDGGEIFTELPETSDEGTLELKLLSPAGAEPAVYQWPLVTGRGENLKNRAVEIVETMRFVVNEFFPEMRPALTDIFVDYDPKRYTHLQQQLSLDYSFLSSYFTRSYEKMKNMVGKFNRVLHNSLQMEKRAKRDERLSSRSSKDLLRFILKTVYNEAVTNPDDLNEYRPFSSEVYGETSFDLICQMIDNMLVTEEDTFIDLGSGVGQVVLQLAASTNCKMIWGIERAEIPSRYAMDMGRLFKKWMNWWGKPYGNYKLVKGNFLNSKHAEKIRSSSIVFVNNFAFGPKLDNKLKGQFMSLSRDGTRIIVSRTLCPRPSSKVTERNESEIEAITHTRTLFSGSVSWTHTPVTFFLHTIDRS